MYLNKSLYNYFGKEDEKGPASFDEIPRTMKGHFILNFYAAVYRLINHIRRISQGGGDDLDTTFKKYPFLLNYFEEMRRYFPKRADWKETLEWWECEITAWEDQTDEHLPLRALAERTGISFESRMALMMVGLVDEDSRFGTLIAMLQ